MGKIIDLFKASQPDPEPEGSQALLSHHDVADFMAAAHALDMADDHEQAAAMRDIKRIVGRWPGD